MREAGKQHHLLALLHRSPHEVEGLGHLRLRQPPPCAGEHGDAGTAAPRSSPAVIQEIPQHGVQAFAHFVRHIHVDPRALLRRQVQHVLLAPPEHNPLQLQGKLLYIARAGREPMAVVVARGIAIALGEGEEAAPQGMAHQLQQREQVPRPVGERGAGEDMHRRIGFALATRCRWACRTPGRTVPIRQQLPRQDAATGAVVLEIVRLVKHEPGERDGLERLDLALQEVVVDDHPAAPVRPRAGLGTDHVRWNLAKREPDLTRPVVLHRRRTDHQIRTRRRRLHHRQHRLPRLAETHVVGKDGAPPPQEERHPFHLMRIQPFGNPLCPNLGRLDAHPTATGLMPAEHTPSARRVECAPAESVSPCRFSATFRHFACYRRALSIKLRGCRALLLDHPPVPYHISFIGFTSPCASRCPKKPGPVNCARR